MTLSQQIEAIQSLSQNTATIIYSVEIHKHLRSLR
jgi:hypothetical protein